jgi:hypothetical protein
MYVDERSDCRKIALNEYWVVKNFTFVFFFFFVRADNEKKGSRLIRRNRRVRPWRLSMQAGSRASKSSRWLAILG